VRPPGRGGPGECGRPARHVFFEGLRARPAAVWRRLQALLGVPAVAVAVPAMEYPGRPEP
jgi:hypothetical protein